MYLYRLYNYIKTINNHLKTTIIVINKINNDIVLLLLKIFCYKIN